MRLVAALASGAAVGLAVALLLGGFAPRVRRGSRLADWLVQAGSTLTPVRFRLLTLGVFVGAFATFTAVAGVWTVALVPAVAASLVPRAYLGRARERRLLEVQRAWPDGLRDLVASIAAGMSLQRAIETMARTGPEPLRRAFGRFPLLARTVGVPAALEAIREELADPTSDRVIEVLIIAHRRGGSLVPEILRDLAAATTRDVWASEEIATQSLEQKINARAVFVLPWIVLVALTARQGAFRDFYGTRLGGLVIAVGGLMSLLGIVIVSRLGREPDEPRVLAGRGAES